MALSVTAELHDSKVSLWLVEKRGDTLRLMLLDEADSELAWGGPETWIWRGLVLM